MIQAIIFDLDGTLLDSVDLHAKAWVDAFQQFGYKVSFEKVRSQIGNQNHIRIFSKQPCRGSDQSLLRK